MYLFCIDRFKCKEIKIHHPIFFSFLFLQNTKCRNCVFLCFSSMFEFNPFSFFILSVDSSGGSTEEFMEKILPISAGKKIPLFFCFLFLLFVGLPRWRLFCVSTHKRRKKKKEKRHMQLMASLFFSSCFLYFIFCLHSISSFCGHSLIYTISIRSPRLPAGN